MYPDYLAHYGVKGMKWGVRKKEEQNKLYTVAQRKADRSMYGLGGERRINKRMNSGQNVSTARRWERRRKKTIKGTAAGLAAVGGIAAVVAAKYQYQHNPKVRAAVNRGIQKAQSLGINSENLQGYINAGRSIFDKISGRKDNPWG